jgi:thiamine pyrophosphate-dependent acetolactate synthase large subunit-like protein
MGGHAVWTAARHRIPLLVLLNNNRSYFNDELHQETVAVKRGREPANRWIGQRMAARTAQGEPWNVHKLDVHHGCTQRHLFEAAQAHKPVDVFFEDRAVGMSSPQI